MRTKQRRPDLFAQFEPADKRDRRLLEEIARGIFRRIMPEKMGSSV